MAEWEGIDVDAQTGPQEQAPGSKVEESAPAPAPAVLAGGVLGSQEHAPAPAVVEGGEQS